MHGIWSLINYLVYSTFRRCRNEGSEGDLPKSEINSTDNQQDELSEYDSRSEEEDNADDAPSEENHGNAEISRDVDFLVGAITRFGRSVRFNRRF